MKPNIFADVRRCLIVVLGASLAIGCERREEGDIGTRKSSSVDRTTMNAKSDSAARFDRILEMIWDNDEKTRENGMKDLADFQRDTKEPSSVVGLKALRAAVRPYAFKKPDPARVSSALVAVAESDPLPEYVSVVVESFEKLSDDAKWHAQIILGKIETREAAEAFMYIIRAYAPSGKLPSLMVSQLVNSPRHAEVLFPEILKYAADPKLSYEIYRLCLAYCETGLVTPDQLVPFSDQILKCYNIVADKLYPAQKETGIDWMWEEKYQESREDAALLLDLLGYLPSDRVEEPLRAALNFTDPKLKKFAVVSLLRLGKSVEAKHLVDVASHAEMRNWLYLALRRLGKSALFPPAYQTQKAFAESDMVIWLVYPTELNRVPDEIELMKIVAVDTGLPEGIYDYYLFRFRTKEPHWAAKDGWIAGVSGPYLRKDEPTTDALGDTFSSFNKWDAKTPDEHVGDIRELMEKWREYQLKKN